MYNAKTRRGLSMEQTIDSQAKFDFPRHRSEAIEKYRAVRGVYEAFANAVRDILRVSIPSEYQIYSLEARAKDADSFGDKAARCSGNDPTVPQYPDPLVGITDLAGVRVIVFFPKTLAGVERCINDEFSVIERADKAEELIASGKFGYQSIHYLVKLKTSRTALPEYRRFEGVIAEIQVRTILQHAWAEMEHDIQYKSIATIPPLIRRRFMSLAGMLEIADREFQAIQDEDEMLRQQERSTVQEGLAGVVDLQQKVAPLEIQIRETQESRQVGSTYLTGSARALLDKGYFEEAVRAYDHVIDAHPATHTNYLGRARARFLAGDPSGALADLDTAEGMYPYDPVIERLRLQISEGSALPAVAHPLTPARVAVVQGDRQLSGGDAAGAFASFTKAHEAGWSASYSKFNQAMALCLGNEIDRAVILLNELHPEPGSFMELHTAALRAICAVRTGADVTGWVQKLNELEQIGRFEYWRSPLRFLEAGLAANNGGLNAYAPLFDTLKAADSAHDR